ncbi:uncharacterized protein LOC141904046 [Tubulanus polymorphus]|uniref:uncharacterized protein LOC141904046 n=1 Tax=Tubulanus polymorphus TaxID=672921 RepID=UPI003DA6C1A6
MAVSFDANTSNRPASTVAHQDWAQGFLRRTSSVDTVYDPSYCSCCKCCTNWQQEIWLFILGICSFLGGLILVIVAYVYKVNDVYIIGGLGVASGVGFLIGCIVIAARHANRLSKIDVQPRLNQEKSNTELASVRVNEVKLQSVAQTIELYSRSSQNDGMQPASDGQSSSPVKVAQPAEVMETPSKRQLTQNSTNPSPARKATITQDISKSDPNFNNNLPKTAQDRVIVPNQATYDSP